MNTKLYYHKTDGGAEYLCTSPVEGTDEGDLYTALIRLDGEPELLRPIVPLEVLETVSDSLYEAISLTDENKNYNRRWMEEWQKAFVVIKKARGE